MDSLHKQLQRERDLQRHAAGIDGRHCPGLPAGPFSGVQCQVWAGDRVAQTDQRLPQFGRVSRCDREPQQGFTRGEEGALQPLLASDEFSDRRRAGRGRFLKPPFPSLSL